MEAREGARFCELSWVTSADVGIAAVPAARIATMNVRIVCGGRVWATLKVYHTTANSASFSGKTCPVAG